MPRRTLLACLLAATASLALAGPAQAGAVGFVVNDLDDVSDALLDGTCDATGADTCTLRAAIEEANNASGAYTKIATTLHVAPISSVRVLSNPTPNFNTRKVTVTKNVVRSNRAGSFGAWSTHSLNVRS